MCSHYFCTIGAPVTGATVTGASVIGAIVAGASVIGAIVIGASVTGAMVTGTPVRASVGGAVGLAGTAEGRTVGVKLGLVLDTVKKPLDGS